MKRIIVVTLLLMVSVMSFTQPTTNTSPVVKNDLLQKAKHQRNAGNAMLWGGAGVTLIGGIIQLAETSSSFNNGKKRSSVSKIIVGIGVVSMIGSIPLFIAYHSNKKKGMGLSFKNETVPLLQKGSFISCSVPSLSLKIRL